jgi:hypothetical protein
MLLLGNSNNDERFYTLSIHIKHSIFDAIRLIKPSFMKSFLKNVLFILLFLLVSLNFSCRKKMICPAYNSAFILGDDDQFQFLTQFTNDSVPEIKESLRTFMTKNEFGIVVKVKEKKKWKLVDFVPTKMVLPLIDSTLMDSTGQMPMPGYNREQLVYMRKFSDLLVFDEPVAQDSTAAEPQGKKKKKKKDKEEDEELEELDEDDPDFDPWSTGGDANW